MASESRLSVYLRTMHRLESLIESLRIGPPRDAYRARQELIGFGRAAESPLVHLLTELKDAHRILEVLAVLQDVKISASPSVDAVVRLLSHKNMLVRRAAAHCLLASSPKLRRVLPQIRAAHGVEKEADVLATLQKLLDRYPVDAA